MSMKNGKKTIVSGSWRWTYGCFFTYYLPAIIVEKTPDLELA
jgi:hypothetical protein